MAFKRKPHFLQLLHHNQIKQIFLSYQKSCLIKRFVAVPVEAPNATVSCVFKNSKYFSNLPRSITMTSNRNMMDRGLEHRPMMPRMGTSLFCLQTEARSPANDTGIHFLEGYCAHPSGSLGTLRELDVCQRLCCALTR